MVLVELPAVSPHQAQKRAGPPNTQTTAGGDAQKEHRRDWLAKLAQVVEIPWISHNDEHISTVQNFVEVHVGRALLGSHSDVIS